jgi:hypothetical protein
VPLALAVRAFEGVHAALQTLYFFEERYHRATEAAAVRLARTL